jgi:hypothetical protein
MSGMRGALPPFSLHTFIAFKETRLPLPFLRAAARWFKTAEADLPLYFALQKK